MDKELFKTLPGTILNEPSFGLLMADLKEIKGKLLQVFKLLILYLNQYLNPIWRLWI